MTASRNGARRYFKGQTVVGQVDRVLPFGVFVQLEDGTRAYIRRRELSLDGDITPSEIVIEGQEIEAVVIALPEQERSMELSVRPLLPDPWEEFTSKYQEGDVVTATVRDLAPDGVFVRVMAGVSGFIPLRELAPWPVEKPEDVVWIGDHIEAVITWIDNGQKKVQLSIRRWLERLSRAEEVVERLHRQTQGQPVDEPLVEVEKESAFSIPEEWSAGFKPDDLVLVVDDDETIRKELVKVLTRHGCPALGTKTASEALELCRNGKQPRLILVDLDLPEMDGLSLIRTLRECDGSTPVAVMSSPEWIEEHLAEIQALGVVGVFPKPLDLDDILSLIHI